MHGSFLPFAVVNEQTAANLYLLVPNIQSVQ